MENANQPIYPDPMRGAEQSFTNQFPHDLPMGLTKREYFTGLAMQGIMASLTEMQARGGSTLHYAGLDEILAREAVSIADAVLKELDKPKDI